MAIGKQLTRELGRAHRQAKEFIAAIHTPPTCKFCEGPVDEEPGKYMVVFAHGDGPAHGEKFYLCEKCALGVL